MASLYTQKSRNITKTWVMMTLFFAIVIAIGWIFSQAYGNPSILYFAVIFSIIMNVLSYWYSDKLVLGMTRAQPVTRENARELYNIVENLCITAGLPVPKIYIINEPVPNAFATGRNPEHAALAVTTGLLETLEKSEIEGVVAHELSHISNRDMLVSTVAIVLVGFISILSDVFMRSLWFTPSRVEGWGGGRRGGNRNNAQGIILILAIAASILAPIAATLMQLAISRRREFLADTSGALLTRYPEGLASALQKISRDPRPMHAATNTNAHLWFDNPFDGKQKKPWFSQLFSTHPPVEDRINALRGMKI